jgi:hypothetical protein
MYCQHEECTCMVDSGDFCSDFCRDHSGEGHSLDPHNCDCGHPDCEGTS